MAGVVLGVAAVRSAARSGGLSFAGDPVGAVALLAAGWTVLAGALVLGRRRPTLRTSALLVAVAGTWFVAEWNHAGAGSALGYTIGSALFAATPALVAWAVLGYPTGRLGSRLDVALIATTLTACLLLGVLPALFFDPVSAGCGGCPANLLLVDDDVRRSLWLGRIGLSVAAAALLAVLLVAVWRTVTASAARRRAGLALTLTGGGFLLVVAVRFLAGRDRGFVGSSPLDRRLWLAQAILLTALGAAVVWSIVRERRARTRIAGLVVRLGQPDDPGGLRHSIAQTLSDPGLVLGYPIDGGRHVDAAGDPVDTTPGPGRASTPLVLDGTEVAVLVHRPGLLDDTLLLAEVAGAARLGLEQEGRRVRLRAREQDLRASRARLVEAGDAERRRLERDVHDGAQQRLIALLLGARMLHVRLGRQPGSGVTAMLDEVMGQLQRAVEELRVIAHGIHPAVLSDEGLLAAVDALAEEVARPVVVNIGDARYPASVENAAYRVIAEAARCGLSSVTASRRDGALVLDVQAATAPERLVDLEDRVGALNGTLRVREEPGGAVRLRAEIPCG